MTNNINIALDMMFWRGIVLLTWLNYKNWNSQEARIRNQIYMLARANGYSRENALYLVKQSNLETGFQRLGFYAKGTNNLFGMHYPSVRPATNSGSMHNESEGGLMSVYKNTGQAIYDRILWDQYNKIDAQAKDYPERVQQANYNSDPLYSTKVQAVDARLNSTNYYLWILLVLVVVLVTLWIRRSL